MRKLSFLLCFGLLGFTSNATTFNVSTVEEFLAAIGSDRTIVLAPGEYIIAGGDGEMPETYGNEHLQYTHQFDGYELHVSGVENLTIKGSGKLTSHLITQPSYGYVIVFKYSSNLVLDNLKAGHGPEKGTCTGGVFDFQACNNVTINKCFLYGSGRLGISGSVNNLTMNKTTIDECTYHIMEMTKCNNLVFNKCNFSNNVEFDMVMLFTCNNVTFNKCKFTNNNTYYSDWCDYKFFLLKTTQNVVLNKCRITDNSACYFSNEEKQLYLNKCKLSKNTWHKGMYGDE